VHHYAENPVRAGAYPKDSAATSEINGERGPTDTRRLGPRSSVQADARRDGPHASLAVKKASGSLPQKRDLMKPTRTVEFDDPAEVKGRKGRSRKTGRPGR
jgi:hypothetical protein